MRTQWFTRIAAGMVALLAVITVQRSLATATVPNETRSTYTVAVLDASPLISLGTRNTPVMVLVGGLENYRYVSMFTLMCTDANSATFMSFSGIDSQGTARGGVANSAFEDVFVGYALPNLAMRTSTTTGKFYFINNNSAAAKIMVTQIW